jgi:hypothetical protein
MKKGYLILKKYCLFERYWVEHEKHTSIGDMNTITFILNIWKLNKKIKG